jgi:TolB protein
MRYWISLVVLMSILWGESTTLEVNKNVSVLSKLSVVDSSSKSVEQTQKFHKMLVADMKVVSLFDVDQSYIQESYDAKTHANALFVLRYRLEDDGSGGFKSDVKLFQNGLELFSKTYMLKQREMVVFLAHAIAYDVNSKMGGASLEWMKRKVIMVRLNGARKSEIVAADYTLSYQKVLLGGGMYGFAKWANREQTDFYYTSLSDFKPSIYKANLATGAKEKIISSDGMAVCSDVSENAQSLLLTLAPNGQPDIYKYDLITKEKTRITNYSGIDVNGQFMGNDTIAFVSNRFGNPNIFGQKINSSAVNQLVFEGKNNSSFSAYRNWIVYKTRGDSGFDLKLASLNGGSSRTLTTSGDNDYPRFSYDGEAIMHIKQEGSRSLVGIIRLGLGKSFAFPLHIGRIQSLDW